MQKQGKVWGWTASIFSNNNVEINFIYAKKGGYCSVHRHNCKYNLFFVITGKLLIKIWKKSYKLIDKSYLNKFDSTVVVPGEEHQFKALKNTYALEIYWVHLSLDDIQRKNIGGKK